MPVIISFVKEKEIIITGVWDVGGSQYLGHKGEEEILYFGKQLILGGRGGVYSVRTSEIWCALYTGRTPILIIIPPPILNSTTLPSPSDPSVGLVLWQDVTVHLWFSLLYSITYLHTHTHTHTLSVCLGFKYEWATLQQYECVCLWRGGTGLCMIMTIIWKRRKDYEEGSYMHERKGRGG